LWGGSSAGPTPRLLDGDGRGSDTGCPTTTCLEEFMPQRRTSLPRGLGELLVAVVAVLGVLLASISAASSDQPDAVTPLAQAHAHNDYENDRPLLDALDHGFTSVETDVWLMGDELYVAHDRGEVAPGGTLETLYLEPLAERVRANGGRVHPGWRHSFHLLVDVKSEARPTYRAIHRTLRKYEPMLTRFSPGGVKEGAVSVTISGHRDLGMMARQKVRYAAYDGRLSDLDGGRPAALVPLVSDDWTETFTWRGSGVMPASERRRLRAIVTRAHAAGRRVRFWGTTDLPASARERIWQEGLAAGVDYLDTDHLSELREVILTNDATPSVPLVGWQATRRATPAR
jgi:hypothetical protein